MKIDKQETEQEVSERFDREIRQTLLEEANEMRKEQGLPLLTAEEIDMMEIPAM